VSAATSAARPDASRRSAANELHAAILGALQRVGARAIERGVGQWLGLVAARVVVERRACRPASVKRVSDARRRPLSDASSGRRAGRESRRTRACCASRTPAASTALVERGEPLRALAPAPATGVAREPIIEGRAARREQERGYTRNRRTG